MKRDYEHTRIDRRIKGILLGVIVLALVISLFVVAAIQLYYEKTYSYYLLEASVEDLYNACIGSLDDSMGKGTGDAQSNSQAKESGEPDMDDTDSDDRLMKAVAYRRVGTIGTLLVVDSHSGKIIGSTDNNYVGESLDSTTLLPGKSGEIKKTEATILGKGCYVVSVLVKDYYIIGIYPKEEAGLMPRVSMVLMILLISFIMICIFVVLHKLLKTLIVDSIYDTNRSLAKITAGDLEEKVKVRSSLEFAQLSEGINVTVDRLKQLIAEADARIDEELTMAKTIQQVSLPDSEIFCRSRNDFGLYATMETAKMVGGDFFDFYMLSENVLAVTIADVSDKGIPAAMFMMRAKALLKNLATEGKSLAELVTAANASLWENNGGNMFVTAWIGFIDLQTGNVSYVHAGHTYPVLIRKDGPVFVKQKAEIFIGGIPGAVYHEQKFTMQPGDQLFLYTDGVTEAFGKEEEIYGNERLLSVLSGAAGYGADADMDIRECCKRTCRLVEEDVRRFTEGEAQSDDITMLCVMYHGPQPETEE